MTDPIFDQIYNDTLLAKLEKRFGPFQHRHFDLARVLELFFNLLSNILA